MMYKPSDYFSQHCVEELKQYISKMLDKCGLYYRIFARSKSDESTLKKLQKKGYSHESGYLMQDFIGIRIALYYFDDIEICKEIIRKHFSVVDISVTTHDPATFKPERLNIVCKIPDTTLNSINSNLWTSFPIDQTFEIQIRTIFSEGWHEIEHDIRYKSNTDWKTQSDLSRNLNGILATLENCDWSIVAITNDLSYREYKERQWANMIKNKFRIRLKDDELNDEIKKILDEDQNFAKSLYRADRKDFIIFLSEMSTTIPINVNNIIYLFNHLHAHNELINAITPAAFYKVLNYS